MNRRHLAALLFSLWDLPSPALAAFELDDAEVSLPAGPMGIGANPAALVDSNCWRWTTDHFVPFGLRQLASTSASTAFRLGRGPGLGGGVRSTGFSLHRETTTWLGVAHRMGKAVDLGVSFTFQELRQPRLHSYHVGMSAGARLRLQNGLQVGLWYQQREAIAPSQLFLSIRGNLDSASVVTAHWRKSSRNPPRTDAAVDSQLHQRLRLLLGLRSHPRRFAAGAVFVTGGRKLAFATTTHPFLGLSHRIAVGNTCRPL